MRQQFTANTAGTFKTYIYENNRKVVPVSAALTVSMPGSKSLLIDGAAMTVAVDGLISYALSASDSRDPAVGYMAEIAYLYNSEACRITVFYDVVRMRLAKVITDEDVVNELPQIKEGGLTARGQAEGGSATTIVDTELKRYDDDYFRSLKDTMTVILQAGLPIR
ncbi:MAG: hypothetical protein HZB21_04170 [Deltaproteobacteria bacterium]|nr:hypothetical protein [Deltaproteobacteria bacterium]